MMQHVRSKLPELNTTKSVADLSVMSKDKSPFRLKKNATRNNNHHKSEVVLKLGAMVNLPTNSSGTDSFASRAGIPQNKLSLKTYSQADLDSIYMKAQKDLQQFQETKNRSIIEHVNQTLHKARLNAHREKKRVQPKT